MGFLPALQSVQGSALPRGLTSSLMRILSSCRSCLLPGMWKTLCFAIKNCFSCFEYELLELEMPWVFMVEADGWRMLWKTQCIDCLCREAMSFEMMHLP